MAESVPSPFAVRPGGSPVTTTLILDRLHDVHDEDAWVAFDARFRDVIRAAARRIGLSPEDADDAAQETMLRAVRDYRAGRYDRSRGRLSSWIVGIAHHRIMDVLRRRTLEGSPAAERAVTIADPDHLARAFDEALERQIFEEAWRRLPKESDLAPATLLAFELTALRGVPPAEAARMSGLSIDQVYVARSRTASRLREIVDRIDRAVRDGMSP